MRNRRHYEITFYLFLALSPLDDCIRVIVLCSFFRPQFYEDPVELCAVVKAMNCSPLTFGCRKYSSLWAQTMLLLFLSFNGRFYLFKINLAENKNKIAYRSFYN